MEFKELLEESKEAMDVGVIVFTHSEFKDICPYRILGSDCCTDGGVGKTCEPSNCRYVNAKLITQVTRIYDNLVSQE